MKNIGLESGVSLYGSVSSDPKTACAVLRAKALSHGISLKESSTVDLAAAAIGADAWSLINKTDSFEMPSRFGANAVLVLASILSRAAGSLKDYSDPHSEAVASSEELIKAAEAHSRWAQKAVGSDAPLALRKAASDLAGTDPSSPLASYAELLSIVADNLEFAPVLRSR